MYCLHCGGCCKTMSPKSGPFPCPDLIRVQGLYFCRCYERRPDICRNFYFDDLLFCPYGLNQLQLDYPADEAVLWERVERGRQILARLHETRKARENQIQNT
ncbi:hypothetical protein U27_04661 [Candidatus Vecturithrix granuli]|uniref:Uncharacterized protein n=1 Tax=Vecturithrix granuli TaxID=1499967 RepID=A0A081BZD9_VECG1|nr:hypothetical protein U27_04661 [Candidatus Vecturithrix granuli]